ncbi:MULTISPECIES: ABC transporter permease [Actinomyces]|uniref:ABC transporter permease n=1 Tax=Actinomyces respiraculi TaxID=2744574 RepID=A0A7T0LMI2_9ACTO|nr:MULTISPECIES: ABC transporter permease [Actinomyces]QPL06073.1 ABC transporter permease [Actinomyces respiraculi]
MSTDTSHSTAWLDTAGITRPHTVSPFELNALRPVGKRPPLGAYTRELWRRRHFIWADGRARALGSQRGTVLGNVWLVAQPMLNAMVFYIMFGLLLQTSRGIDNFIGYLIIGVTMFPPIQRAVNGGSQVLTNGRNLIRGFSFPRASLPVSYVIRTGLDSLPPLAAISILVLVLPPHAILSWRWLLVFPIFMIQQLFCLGLVFISSRITTLIPDLRNIWPFLTQFWYFGSGVFFSYERFVDHPAVLKAMDLNPGYLILTMYRNCMLYNRTPDTRSWILLLAWSVGLSVVGFVFFWQKEEAYGVEH